MIELASILVLGIFAQWVSWKVKLPAIFPLILIGLVVGPLASSDLLFGYKLIDPDRIFEGNMLSYFVSLSVGIILFEGGLTLRLKEVRQVASTVRNLVTIGPIISLVGGGLAAHYIAGLDLRIALLFGSLIIVTGPTVIGPILRNVQARRDVATVLKWESIVIDPIGALVAVLMYEFIISGNAGSQFTQQALSTFGLTLLAGSVAGAFFAWLLYYMLRKKRIPDYLINVVSLAMVTFCFTSADLVAKESGLLAVTVMGMILANLKLPELQEILNFKESLTVLLISILFIILSADIEIEQLQKLGWDSVLIFLIVVFVLRPITVFVSAIGSSLSFRDRLFISWIGPRGIVAAAIASIFAISILEHNGLSAAEKQDAELLIPLTFLIILGTVVIQGTTAKLVARALGITEKDRNGYLILGAHEAGRAIAGYLQRQGLNVILVDTSHTNVNEAKMMNLSVIERNILSEDLSDNLELSDVGQFMALTANNELNIFACRKFRKDFEGRNAYRLITRNEMKFTSLVRPKDILFGAKVDFYRLINGARKNPSLRELPINSQEQLSRILTQQQDTVIPVFLRHKDNKLDVILNEQEVTYREGDSLAYFGDLPSDADPASGQ